MWKLFDLANARALCLFRTSVSSMAFQAISGLHTASEIETVEILTGFTVLAVYSEKFDGSNILIYSLII